jgi:hypothetical protein
MGTKVTAEQAADKSAERREKLKALRQKQQEHRSTGMAETDSKNRLATAGAGQAGMTQDRPKLRKLLEQRRLKQSEGGAGHSDSAPHRGGKLRELMGKGKRGRGGDGGFDLESFPRLLDAGRRKKGVEEAGIDASSSLQEITAYRERLQARADLLSKALDKTLDEVEKVKKMESNAAGKVVETTE